MGAKADFVRDFPRLGGERMLRAASERILEVVFEHIRSREALRHGQVLWMGIATEERPGWCKPLSRMQLVPLLLELVTDQDIDAILKREKAGARLPRRCPRLCRQAHKQGGLLSNCDLAVLLGCSDSTVAQVVSRRCGVNRSGQIPENSLLRAEGFAKRLSPTLADRELAETAC